MSTIHRKELIEFLSLEKDSEIEELRKRAYKKMAEKVGEKVYLRGLVEFSNICSSDCYYCGIRKSNNNIERYRLSEEQILNAANWAANKGFGSLVLQSGEINSPAFTDFVENIIIRIKEETTSPDLPQGLGITLSTGEQDYDSYRRFYRAGAHRYLLRIESSSERHFTRLHPDEQLFETRLNCLRMLKYIGFQVGTGIMIGFPQQTVEDLADDILFMKNFDVDMVGMGPFLIHGNTPMAEYIDQWRIRKDEITKLALKMIAATRLAMPDINIAATTALETINENGKELGLQFGANVIMPNLTPADMRKNYSLYNGRAIDDEFDKWSNDKNGNFRIGGRPPGLNEWGDSPHFKKKYLMA